MKLHLPIALLTAVICAMSFAQGATSGTYYVLDDQVLDSKGKVTKPSSVVYNPEKAPDNAQGTYTFSTDENGTVHSSFVGVGSYATPLKSSDKGSDKYVGAITAMNPWYTNTDGVDHKADSVNYTIGDGATKTQMGYASGAGVRGQVVTGDKTITVKNNAYVANLAGGQFLADSWNVDEEATTPGVTLVQVQKGEDVTTYAYDASSKDSTTTINVEDGGKVSALVGGLYALSGPSGVVDKNGYSPFVTKDAVDINVSGANAYVGIMAGALSSSINNDVNITISEGAKVDTIWAGSVANGSTAKLYVQSTCIELDGANAGAVYAGGDGANTEVKGNATVILKGDNNSFTSISGLGDNGGTVNGERTLVFDTVSDKKITDYLSKSSNFNAIGFKDTDSAVDFDDKQYNGFDTLYVAGSNPDKPTVVTTDAGREFRKIHVQEGGQLDMGNAKGETSKYILTGTGVALEEALVVDGTMNVNNAHLVIQGTNSQLGIGYNSNNAVMNVVNSTVDMTGTSTVHMGYYNGMGGTLNIERGSKFIGGANNAWLGGGEINVVGGSSMEVCSTPQQYNYRTILGMSGNTLDLNIKDHSSFTSKATQFITNYNSDTTVNITVDGEGSILYQAGKTESKGSSYVIGTSGEWVTEEITKSDGTTTTVWRDKDTKGSVAGANKDKQGNPLPSDTITYIASAGTNAAGELYGTVNNARTTITAENGGKVQIDSARTYVGDVRDHATYGEDLNKSATFNVGKDSSMSFKKLDIYANTNVNFTESKGSAEGTFKTTGVNLNKGAELNITGTAEHKGNFELNGGGMYIYGGVVNVNSANVDLSNGGTLSMGYYGEADSRLNITNGSEFKGASQNAWLGAGEVNVSGGSSLTVCTGNGTVNNYRVLMGLHDGDLVKSSTIKLNVTEGSSFTSEASRFVTNYHSNTEVNITVDGEGSTFTQEAEARVTHNPDNTPHMEDTITYLLARGVDNNGELPYMPNSSNDYRNGIVNNVSTTITATNGGKIDFQSSQTYIGFAKDKEVFDGRGETMNKKATFNVGAGSSLSFKDVEVYANTVVNNNGGTFKAGEMNINNGGQLTFNVNTASAVMTAEKLTVYTGGTLSFVQPAAAEGTSLAMEAPATTTVTLDSDLVLLAGSTLVLDPGMLVNLGYNDLTIQDGATIVLGGTAAALTMTDAEVATLFQTAGTFTALDKDGNIKADGIASVTFNGSTVGISVGNGVVANVPEPTTATLSLLALAGLCARRRRK